MKNVFLALSMVVLEREFTVDQNVAGLMKLYEVTVGHELDPNRLEKFRTKLLSRIRLRPAYRLMAEYFEEKMSEDAARAALKMFKEHPEIFRALLGREFTMVALKAGELNVPAFNSCVKEEVPELYEAIYPEFPGDEWKSE